MAKLISIAAIGGDYELGKNGNLIWRIKEDMKFFKNTTMGHKIVMGYNTFVTLPSHLPGRTYVILTHRNIEVEGAHVFHDFDTLTDYLDTLDEDVYIVGGASIYKLFLPLVSEMYLTEIGATDKDADAFYPEFSKDDFTRTIVESHSEENPPYEFAHYKRK